MKRWMAQAMVAAGLALAAGGASAQQCQGFTDVLQSDSFCEAVEWIKNRAVTSGCTATAYCPGNNVTRAQMALFMQRLGNALTPELLGAQGASDDPTLIPGEFPDPAILTCITSVSAATPYPRKAVVTAMFSGLADANPASFRAFLLMNPNNGGFQQLVPNVSAAARETLAPNSWGTVAVTEVVNLEPGLTYRFAVAVRRDNLLPQAGTLARYRCQLTATLSSRTGTTAPF